MPRAQPTWCLGVESSKTDKDKDECAIAPQFWQFLEEMIITHWMEWDTLAEKPRYLLYLPLSLGQF